MNAGGGHLLPGARLLGGLQADLHWREKGLIIIIIIVIIIINMVIEIIIILTMPNFSRFMII